MTEIPTVSNRAAFLVAALGILLLLRSAPGWSDRVGAARAREQTLRAALAELNAPSDSTRDETAMHRWRDSITLALPAATSLGTASGAFVSEVADAATSAGLQLETLTPEGDSASLAPFLITRVRSEGWGDIGALMTFLSLLENEPIRLRVRELTVTSSNPEDDAIERLRVRLVVEGLYRRKQGAQP